jgi:glycerophosphoryl diester phosphodiesterase
VNIEIKDNSATTFVLEILQKYSLEKNWNSKLFQISSFDWDVLQVCDSNNSKISLGVITENSIEEALIFAKKIKANAINPHFKLLSFENVLVMHENGFKIFPWTVNQLEDITFVKSLKVDGIISDFPDRI